MINQNHLIFLSFGKRGDTGGGDYLGEHWIKGLRDLIPMSFFKYVMILQSTRSDGLREFSAYLRIIF